jgi:hypothetical protein
LSGICLIVRRTERDIIINSQNSSCKITVSCQILINVEYFCQILEKYLNITFDDNPSIVGRVVQSEQRDRHGETRIWTFIVNNSVTWSNFLLLLSGVVLIFLYLP